MIRGQVTFVAAKVPFAGHQGAIALRLKPGGDRHDAWLKRHGVARLTNMLARQHFGDGGNACLVIVDPGQQHGARRRA